MNDENVQREPFWIPGALLNGDGDTVMDVFFESQCIVSKHEPGEKHPDGSYKIRLILSPDALDSLAYHLILCWQKLESQHALCPPRGLTQSLIAQIR